MSAAHEIRHVPFWDDRLSFSANKAVEMARNGAYAAEIAEELEIGTPHVSALLRRARDLGIEAPRLPYPAFAVIPNECVAAARARALRAGVPKHKIVSTLAAGLGMTRQAVFMRLRRIDKQKGQST